MSRRDEGAVLPLVLVMMVIGALVVIPLLGYSVSVLRANRVVMDSTREREAAEAGLRVALLRPTELYSHCTGSTRPVVQPVGDGGLIEGMSVATQCQQVAEVGPLNVLGFQNPIGVATVQLGADVPDALIGTRRSGPEVPPYPDDERWWAATPTATDGEIWLPDLPTLPGTLRTPPGAVRATPFAMPAAFDCSVYLPGRYTAPVEITGGNVYFASGVYYFEDAVRIGGDANVVVGYGLAGLPTDCADDVQVGANLIGSPGTFDIDGAGATWVFGAEGQLVIDNSETTSGLSVRFNQRYVQVGRETDRGQRVSIMSVNGGADGVDDVVGHEVRHVVKVPPSMASVNGEQTPLGSTGAGYTPSSATFTSEARTPTAPAGLSATAYRTGDGPDDGAVRLQWDSVTGQDTGGALIESYDVERSVGGGPATAVCVPNEIVAVDDGRLACTVTGLSIGRTHTFAVTATNTAGTSPASTANALPTGSSESVSVPASPTDIAVTPYDRAAEVTWTPGDSGGAPITGFTARAERMFLEPDSEAQVAEGDPPPLVPGYETLGTCATAVTDWQPAATSCVIGDLNPLGPFDDEGNTNVGYRFVVTATNSVGESDEAVSVPQEPLLEFHGQDAPAVADPVQRVLEPWIPEPIVHVNLDEDVPATVSVPGYVSVPMGRVSIENRHHQDVRVIGGILASTIHLDEVTAIGGPESTTVGYQSEIVLQRKIRLVATAGGSTASAVVQINEDGNFAVNSWVVQ